MLMPDRAPLARPARTRRERWRIAYVARRNAIFGSDAFQHWCARLPFVRGVAKSRATQMMDHIVGFTYSQVLKAVIESELLDLLANGPIAAAEVAHYTQLSRDAALALLRAARALDLAEEVVEDGWMLGQQGAVLVADEGTQAMIVHHRLLYNDLIDPLELLRKDRREPTELSRYWSYAGALHGAAERGRETHEYSRLMAASQRYVADQVLAAFSFSGAKSLLDVGGGHGAFVARVGEVYPRLSLGLFDLPEVAANAAAPRDERLGAGRVVCHGGNFFEDAIPAGYDLVSLVRILHDHDDEPAAALLANIRASLSPGQRLLIAEPMARIPGAEPMGEAFFGFYLWAMGSGRARSPAEIIAMLKTAGFASARLIAGPQPVIASMVVATA
ncbi:MAG: methyltransferase [Erythrobacter sp.]|jgi:demethylspheroidene O-methyltransferase|nr:methyltransferase [Erythrobacter sp.]